MSPEMSNDDRDGRGRVMSDTRAARPRLLFVVESGCDVRLAEGLAERFDLRILARRIEGGREISHPPSVPVDVEVGPPSRLRFARLVHRRILEGAIDFVLVQGYSVAALAANVAARRTGVPVAMLVCSPVEEYYRCRVEHPEHDKPFRRREILALHVLARLNARVGRRYIVLSEHLGDVVRAHGGRDVDVIPLYGVDVDRFTPTSEGRAAVRRRMGLPATGALVFFSSRIAPEKDAEALLAATRRLVDEGEDIRLLHRSGGWSAFVEDAARYGLRDRVVAGDAMHPDGDLASFYRACDLCVQASRAEGLGFSPLEALACEVPVVAAHVGGLRETIRDGETGWTYPVGDAVALAARMSEALHAPEEAARRARAGRAMVTARYSRRVAFDALDRLVREEVSRRPGAGRRA